MDEVRWITNDRDRKLITRRLDNESTITVFMDGECGFICVTCKKKMRHMADYICYECGDSICREDARIIRRKTIEVDLRKKLAFCSDCFNQLGFNNYE